MKNQKIDRKKAQGRKSRTIGNLNRMRILSIIQEHPLTFKDLQSKSGLSQPILAKHLKKLKDDGLIEKAIIEDKTVYKIVSDEQLEKEIKADLIDILIYGFFPFKEIADFIADLTLTAKKYRKTFPKTWKEKLYEDKIFKPAEYIQAKARIESKSESKEPLYMFTKEKLEQLRAKYPDAIKELLGE